jgi:hypothetical protein
MMYAESLKVSPQHLHTTNSTTKSPLWKANSRLAGKRNSRLLMETDGSLSRSQGPIIWSINPAHNFASPFFMNLFTFSYAYYMQYCIHEKKNSVEMSPDLHIFNPSELKKLFLKCHLCVWMHARIYVRTSIYVCTNIRLAIVWTDRRILLIIGIRELIHHM